MLPPGGRPSRSTKRKCETSPSPDRMRASPCGRGFFRRNALSGSRPRGDAKGSEAEVYELDRLVRIAESVSVLVKEVKCLDEFVGRKRLAVSLHRYVDVERLTEVAHIHRPLKTDVPRREIGELLSAKPVEPFESTFHFTFGQTAGPMNEGMGKVVPEVRDSGSQSGQDARGLRQEYAID